MTPPQLSIVVLTWNEEKNIDACLASLARQRWRNFEVIVVDAASEDDTVLHVRHAQGAFPVTLRLEVAPRRLPIGAARNLGVSLSRAPNVAFLSADAELDERWTEHAYESLVAADMVFGRQLHDPRAWTVGAAVRALRYNFPEEATSDPLVYASNVAAAYRKDLVLGHRFDATANAAEDLLMARRATASGYEAVYNPNMIVHHHDVATARDEMRKNVREGRAWGAYAHELGLFTPLLLWALAILFALVIFVVRPILGLPLLAIVLYAPAIRRAVLRRQPMPPRQVLVGIAASPLFDLAFLGNYLGGFFTIRRKRPEAPAKRPKEIRPQEVRA